MKLMSKKVIQEGVQQKDVDDIIKAKSAMLE